MKTRTKVALTGLCALLLVAASVLGTLAYLTDTTDVTNTFTVGNVDIKLDETVVDEYGVAENNPATRAEVGNELKLIPGHSYTKDPMITVEADSEDCWIFVKVENGLAGYEKAGETIVDQLTENDNWAAVDTNVYAYKETVSAGDTVYAFKKLNIKTDADLTQLADTDADGVIDAEVKVTAYAVQKDNFATAQAAWDANKTSF